MIARDRGGAYGAAAERPCPGARQVANRWHLFENVSAACLDAVHRAMPRIHAALGVAAVDPGRLTAAEQRQDDGFRRREADSAVIRRLAEARTPIKEIVRRTGRSRKLVCAIVRGGRTEVFRPRMSSLDACLPRLHAEWEVGCRNGAELWRRVRAAGFVGALRVVTEWAMRRRRAGSSTLPSKPLSARATAQLLTSRRDPLTTVDAILVTTVEQAVPALAVARDLLERFHVLLRSKSGAGLDAWLSDAANSLLSTFASGIAADRDAVAAAMAEPWSNGQTEDQITKLKLVKRQMYGRAHLDLLRARLCAARTPVGSAPKVQKSPTSGPIHSFSSTISPSSRTTSASNSARYRPDNSTGGNMHRARTRRVGKALYHPALRVLPRIRLWNTLGQPRINYMQPCNERGQTDWAPPSQLSN